MSQSCSAFPSFILVASNSSLDWFDCFVVYLVVVRLTHSVLFQNRFIIYISGGGVELFVRYLAPYLWCVVSIAPLPLPPHLRVGHHRSPSVRS